MDDIRAIGDYPPPRLQHNHLHHQYHCHHLQTSENNVRVIGVHLNWKNSNLGLIEELRVVGAAFTHYTEGLDSVFTFLPFWGHRSTFLGSFRFVFFVYRPISTFTSGIDACQKVSFTKCANYSRIPKTFNVNISVSFYVNFNHNSIFFVSLFGFNARLKRETVREEGMDYRRKADQANMGKPIWEECFLFTTLLPN